MNRFLLSLSLLGFLALEAFSLEVPKLQARVTDLAGVLSADEVRSLEAKLQDLETTDSTQVALLIIPSLEGEALEDFSHRVATEWKLGQKGRDNAALLFIAMKERKVRIEVGYGLEPTLTDALSRRIIQEEIVPSFREGEYYHGVDAGITAIIKVVRGTYQAPPPVKRRSRGSARHAFDWVIFLFVPFLWVLGAAGKWGGALLGVGAGTFLMFLLFGSGWIPFIIGAPIGGFIGLLLGTLARKGRRSPTRSRWGRHPGVYGPLWTGFGGGGSSGFGGGFSGGGFSGGGGSFGGGGSSGSW